jgi:hypothetical protein
MLSAVAPRLRRFAAVAALAVPLAVLGTRGPAYAAGVAGVLVLFLTSLRTKVLLYVASLALIGWFKIRFPTTEVHVIPNLIALAVFAHLAVEAVTKRLVLPVRSGYAIGVSFLALAVVLQSFNPTLRALDLSPAEGRVYLLPILLFFVGLRFFSLPGSERALLKVFLVLGLVAGVVMLVQLVFGFSQVERDFYIPFRTRVISERKLFSTYDGPDGYAFAAAFFVLAAVAARASGVWPRLAVVVAAVSALGAVTAGVRAVLLGLILAGGLTLLLQLKDPRTRPLAARLLVVAAVVSIALGAAVLASPATHRNETITASNGLDSAVKRLALFKQGVGDEDVTNRLRRMSEFNEFIVEHPGGAGPGFVKVLSALPPGAQAGLLATPPAGLPSHLRATFLYQHDYQYVSMGAELGLVPLILFALLLATGLRNAVVMQAATQDLTRRSMLGLGAGVIVLVSVVIFTNESFRSPQVAGLLWLAAAAPVAYRRPVAPRSGA